MSNNIVPIQEGGGGLDGLCKEPKLASNEKSATRVFATDGDEKSTTRWHQLDFWPGYYPQLTQKNPEKFFWFGRDLNP